MSSSGSGTLVGPAWRSVPAAASSAGQEAIELAASAGLFLDEWQQRAVVDLLGEDAEGYWAATTGGLVCPRQNGKGAVIEALELAWLFLFDVNLIFHSAHLFATASDAFRRIKFLIQNTPDLHRQVLRYSEAHGQEGIELRSGQRLRFVARSKSGGRGFPAPVVVLDEAFNLGKQAMAALVPTMAAQPNPFLLITSSAPIDDECSDVLRGFMRDSRKGGIPRRCYIEYAATSPLDPDDPASFEQGLREANPGYLVRLNSDVIDEEQRLLTPESLLIERFGIVDLTEDTGSKGWQVITEPAWAACLDTGPQPWAPLGPLAWALDVAPDSKTAAIACSDGVHGEITDHRPGTSWVAARLADLRQRHGFVEVALDDKGPAGSLITDLEAAGVPWRKVTLAEHAQACGALLEDINDGVFRHIGQPVLTDAARDAARRTVTDVWLWTRTKSSGDISPLVAVGLARWMATASEGPSQYEERGMTVLG